MRIHFFTAPFMWIRPRETLIKSQSQILQEFLYMTSSWPSLNNSLFASLIHHLD